MSSRSWKALLFASICFFFAGILYLIEKKYLSGIIFITLGMAYVCLTVDHYKKRNKSNIK